MTLLAFAALSLAQGVAQDASQEANPGRLTVNTGTVSVEQGLAQLSKASGLSLRAVPSIADYPLFVRVNGAETRVVLDQVATVLGAQWKAEGDGWILSSDSAYRRTLAKAVDAKRAARIERKVAEQEAGTRALRFDDAFAGEIRRESEKMMEAMTKAATDGASNYDPSAMMTSKLFTGSPASQAINTLLLGIGAEKLAALPIGERVVFALNPTRMQGALPNGSRRALELYAKNSLDFDRAMKNTAKEDEFDLVGMMSSRDDKAAKGPLQDAHLEIWASDDMITASLTTYDATGAQIAQGFSIVDLLPPVSMPTNPAPGAGSGASGIPLQVSDLGREWGLKLKAAREGSIDFANNPGDVRAIFGGGNGAALRADTLGRAPSPALRALLADPVERSLTAPLFDPIAAALPGDLVATVPDSGLPTLAGIVGETGMTGERAIAALESSSQFSVDRSGTLTVVGAATPARMHREFADRRALRELTTALGRVGFLRTDDAARYALAQRTRPGASNLAMPIVTLLQGRAPMDFLGGSPLSEFETLRVYGSLSGSQRTALAAGRPIAFSALSPEANDAVAKILFQSPTGPSPNFETLETGASDSTGPLPGGEEGEEDEAASEAASAEMMSYVATLRSRAGERTVQFAGGLPQGGFLTLASSTEEIYRMTDSTTGATAFGDAGTLGFMRGARDIPYLKNFAPAANFDRFTPAKTISLNFKFAFTPKLSTSKTLEDHETTSTESLTYERLPSEFRTMVEEMSKMASEMKAPPGRIKP